MTFSLIMLTSQPPCCRPPFALVDPATTAANGHHHGMVVLTEAYANSSCNHRQNNCLYPASTCTVTLVNDSSHRYTAYTCQARVPPVTQ